MKTRSVVVALVLLALVSGTVLAKGNQGKGKANRGKAAQSEVDKALRFLNGVELTPEQKTKVEALKIEFTPKLADVKRKLGSILSVEQKQAARDAGKAAKAAGKKGKAAKAEIDAAVKLTPDQKTKMAQARKELRSLGKDLRNKVESLLTADQRAQIKKPAGKGRKGHKVQGAA